MFIKFGVFRFIIYPVTTETAGAYASTTIDINFDKIISTSERNGAGFFKPTGQSLSRLIVFNNLSSHIKRMYFIRFASIYSLDRVFLNKRSNFILSI